MQHEKPKKTIDPNAAEFRALRLKFGLSQAQAAKALGLVRGTVIAWESGQNPCHDNYIKLLKIYAQEHGIN